MNPKQSAAQAALSYLKDDMIVGLGTGSTADYFLEALGEAVRSDKLKGIRGVPTSKYSELRAQKLGITIASLAECPHPDITIDGADEVDPNLDLIKGAGGALLREKVVAQNSKRLVIIIDPSKLVTRLGEHFPLPVEVTHFGHESQELFFKSLGCTPTLRKDKAGHPFDTDNGNYIYDCRFDHLGDAAAIQSKLKTRAGIVESGFFLGMADEVIVGKDNGVEVRKRK